MGKEVTLAMAEKLYAQAGELLGKVVDREIERLARKILKANPDMHEFICAMGSASFTYAPMSCEEDSGKFDPGNLSIWFYVGEEDVKEQLANRRHNNNPECLDDILELSRIMQEYQDLAGFDGRFTAEGPLIERW